MGAKHVHAALRRWPDLESPNLPAADGADRLLLAEAQPLLGELGTSGPSGISASSVVVIGDSYGGIALPLLASDAVGQIRTSTDSLLGERATLANLERIGLDPSRLTQHRLGPDLLTGARLVLLRLPRSLDELREIAEHIAIHADPEVRVVAAGRIKHMTRAMNGVLGECFREVSASLGRDKSRALRASGVRQEGQRLTYPVRRRVSEPALGLDLDVLAHGGAFSGARLDVGTRALLGHLGAMAPGASEAIDLGCGTGIVACGLASQRPELRTTAIDVSASAVASASATVAANLLEERVRVMRGDGLTGLPADSADLIVCNPPMHSGGALSPESGLRLLSEAGRVLRPGGELWTVYNSRLGHGRTLRRMIGPSEVVRDDGRFTVTRTRPRP